MFDVGLSQLALVAVIALVVIGPEKLPRVARTAGTLLGKAQRYMADVKAEVNRTMELEELKKMRDSVASAARDVESTLHQGSRAFENEWSAVTEDLNSGDHTDDHSHRPGTGLGPYARPQQRRAKKNFRLKQQAVPQWFKARQGVRTRALSGAARVARHRPKTRAF